MLSCRVAGTAFTAALVSAHLATAVAGAQAPPDTLTPANPVPVPPVAQTPAEPAPETPADTVVPANAIDPLEALVKPGDRARLSDEKSITRWAHPQDNARIRARPSPTAPAVDRLRFQTEDGVAEVYLVLGAVVDEIRRTWLRIRVPKRPNGTTGWVQQDSLGGLRVVRTRLVIGRRALRATLYKSNRIIWTARVGIGKSGTPTPVGDFYIRERLRGFPGGLYGPWAFGTSAYSTLSDWPGGGVVGIHGTNEPGLIPGRPSHGCVRLRNDKIKLLASLMPIGTPVQIVR
jgi:hypothetical protein